MVNMSNNALLEIKNLSKHYRLKKGLSLKAVENINLKIFRGETLGLVGESGCGKSTLAKVIVRLYRPTAGKVLLGGINVHKCSKEDNKVLFKKMQMIFQDPYASLNPRMTVGELVGEPLIVHNLVRQEEIGEKVSQLLNMVGLDRTLSDRFPHQLSGGQRQRVGIARALSVKPEFIICDEPVFKPKSLTWSRTFNKSSG